MRESSRSTSPPDTRQRPRQLEEDASQRKPCAHGAWIVGVVEHPAAQDGGSYPQRRRRVSTSGVKCHSSSLLPNSRTHGARSLSLSALDMQVPNLRRSPWCSVKKLTKPIPMTIATTMLSAPVTNPATAWPRLSASPREARDIPTAPRTIAMRPSGSAKGANITRTARTRLTTPVTRAAVPTPLRRLE